MVDWVRFSKADAWGSCRDTACDGPGSVGNCYCDTSCVAYGDCCSDRLTYCAGPSMPDPHGSAAVPELGDGTATLTLIGDASDGLSMPRDLAFNPERPDELWTVNFRTDGTVIFFDAGTPDQRSLERNDAFGNHFMAEPSSIAFGAEATFATCHESRNTYNGAAPPNDFMGPTLWPSNLRIYGVVNQDPAGELGGSHIDMQHQSPLCMGIAHERDNVYWVFDGYHGHIVRYDFHEDHGPGWHDHSDGVVRAYAAGDVTRVPLVPSHMVLDPEGRWLYAADTGGRRIIRLDIGSGEPGAALRPHGEAIDYRLMRDEIVEVFVDDGLVSPSGIAWHDDRLFVSDFANGQIVAYDASGAELARLATGASGIMGITFGPDGKLYYVDGREDRLVRVDP